MVIAEPKLINLKKIGHDLDRVISTIWMKSYLMRVISTIWMKSYLMRVISTIWMKSYLMRVICTQHLQRADAAKLRDVGVNQRNAGRIMTDSYRAQINTSECRGLADADDEEDLGVKLTSLQTVWDDIILGFHQWFIKNRLDTFEQSLIMSSREILKINGRYYSNGFELEH